MRGRWPLSNRGLHAAFAVGKRTPGLLDAAWDGLVVCVLGTKWLCHGLGGSPSHAAGWRGMFHAAWVVVERLLEGKTATRRSDAVAREVSERMTEKLCRVPAAARIVTTVTMLSSQLPGEGASGACSICIDASCALCADPFRHRRHRTRVTPVNAGQQREGATCRWLRRSVSTRRGWRPRSGGCGRARF